MIVEDYLVQQGRAILGQHKKLSFESRVAKRHHVTIDVATLFDCSFRHLVWQFIDCRAYVSFFRV